jgi:ATP synthase protein I
MNEDKKGNLKGFLSVASVGIMMVAATLIGFAAGFYIDKIFSTKPFFTIIFTILGVAAGFKNIYTTIKKYGF